MKRHLDINARVKKLLQEKKELEEKKSNALNESKDKILRQ